MNRSTNPDEESAKSSAPSVDQPSDISQSQQANLPTEVASSQQPGSGQQPAVAPSIGGGAEQDALAPKHGEESLRSRGPSVLNQGQPSNAQDLARVFQSIRGHEPSEVTLSTDVMLGCKHEQKTCLGTVKGGILVAKCAVGDKLEEQDCTISELRRQIAEKDKQYQEALAAERNAVDRERKANETFVKDLRETIERLEKEKKILQEKLGAMEGHIAEQDKKINRLQAREAQRTQIVIARSVAYKSLEKVARHVLEISSDAAEEYKCLADIEAAAQEKGGHAALRWDTILQRCGLKSADVTAMDGFQIVVGLLDFLIIISAAIKQVKKVGVAESHYNCGHMEQECADGECEVTPHELHANIAAHFKKQSKVLGNVVSILAQANVDLGLLSLLE